MAKLTIDGIGSVTVDDTFKSLPADQQAAVVEEIAASRGGKIPAAPAAPQAPGGLGNNIGAGLAEGVVGLATSPATALEALSGGNIGGTNKAAWDTIERWTGPRPEAKTTGEKTARGVAEFIPGSLIGPGGMAQKAITYGVIPGIMSEYGKQQFGDAGGIAGAVGGVGVGAGVNRAVAGGRNYLAARGAGNDIASTLGSPVGPGATNRMAQSLTADRVVPADVARLQSELGPEAMLMDIGRQTKGRAEAVAAQPGRGQNTVLDAVEGRTGRFGEATAQRVQQTLDREMGPTHNVVALVDRVDETVKRVAGPLYQKVMDAHPVLTVPAAITERPAVAQAMKDAVQLARQHGENIAGTTERRTIVSGPGFNIGDDVTIPAKTSLRYWDYVKKDLDRRINAYQRSGGTSELNSADKADMGGLMDARRVLVEHLDGVTKGAYKEARQAAATKYELREALDYGRSAFNSKLLPEEFAAELSQMSVPQRTMAQVGFRRELDRLVETTRNEGATARRILDTDSVLQKTELLFGPRAAQEISKRINAENTFQETTQKIASNSRTAVRGELIKDTADLGPANRMQTTLTGVGASVLGKGYDYARNLAQGMPNTRSQIADMLTAQGGDIDPIVQSLLKLGDKRTMNNAAVGSKTSALINALVSGR
jgi:hypothetical protein